MKAILTRLHDDGKQTLGLLQCFEGLTKVFECKTMELPWFNNQRKISCIPAGSYQVRKHNSPSLGKVFKVFDVPDRSEILIHKGNYNSNSLGCILVGKEFVDINDDGTTDITGSGATLELMLMHLPAEFEILII